MENIKNSIYLSTHQVLCNIIWRRSFFLFAALWQLLDNGWKIHLECCTFNILTIALQKSEVMQPQIVPFICLSIISKKFLIKIHTEAQWINDIDQGPKSSNGSHLLRYRNKHEVIKISYLHNDVKQWMGWTVKPAGGRDLWLRSISQCEVARKN